MSNLTSLQKRELAKKKVGTYFGKTLWFTIGEIYRKGLLLNHKGEPYSAKSTVSKELRGQPYKTEKTPFGQAKLYSEDTIKDLNNRW